MFLSQVFAKIWQLVDFRNLLAAILDFVKFSGSSNFFTRLCTWKLILTITLHLIATETSNLVHILVYEKQHQI